MISVLILTLNEEANLGQCLDSVQWSDDIVVLDSFSADRTVEIAKSRGTSVVQRKFDNWASHQNWANENIPFKNPWVFYLDADERMTNELRDEIQAIAANAQESRVAFYCGRRNYFMGRWIKRAYPPSLLMRFFLPSKVRFERLVNPTPVIDGPHGYLKEMFVHYNFSKGFSEWFDKHNRYSQLEALEGVKVLASQNPGVRDLLSGDAARRRKALKSLSFRLPCRPQLRFFHLYVLSLGFMDGAPGYHYCRLITIYEYMISLKMKEIARRNSRLSI
jgi:glycosyltransferase involved in cell wall biosynthesis